MAQQTAVEWFYQRILAGNIKEVFEQAKEMEKEQIKIAYNDGAEDMVTGEYKAMEVYYKKKYSNENTSTKAD